MDATRRCRPRHDHDSHECGHRNDADEVVEESIRKRRKAPATKVESRPRRREVTLITDWPIMAQPPIPYENRRRCCWRPGDAFLTLVGLVVSVMSSTI